MQYDSEQGKLMELSMQLGVLGSYPRLRLILLLCEQEMCVGDLAEKLEMSQSALSQHLKKLRDSKLVHVRRHTQNRYYSIERNNFTSFIDNLSVFDCAYGSKGSQRTMTNEQKMDSNIEMSRNA